MNITIQTISYRGYEITSQQTQPTRFGVLFSCLNNTGEPRMTDDAYKTESESIRAEMDIIDQYIKNLDEADDELNRLENGDPHDRAREVDDDSYINKIEFDNNQQFQ